MSALENRPPSTTRRALVLAAGVGTLALAVFDPTVLLGVVLGAGLAVAIELFADSNRRVAVASALVPIVAGGIVAAVARSGAPIAAVVAVAGAVIAVAGGVVVAGWPRPGVLVRVSSAALSGALVAGGAALLALGVDAAGGPLPALSAVVWATGDGFVGLCVAIGVACVAVVAALVLVPPAAVTGPRGRKSYVSSRNGLVVAIVFATGLALAALFALAFLFDFVLSLEGVTDAIVRNAVVRGLLATVTVASAVLAVFAVVVRWSWLYTDRRRNVAVPVVVGAVAGAGFAAVGAIGVTGSATRSAMFLGATALALGFGWSAAWVLEGARRRDEIPATETVLAGTLAAGGVAVGVSVDVVSLDLETARAGIATLVSIAAAAFAYDAGRYGRVLGREIGPGASRRPQLVGLGWRAAVAGVGVPVAGVGVLFATVLAPTLSVPATAGVLAALLALLAGAWVLVR
ncbi:hypothetical protein [Natrinema marinum]|uniref:hypothetical protein n=1 Tax=Natrinema marinum TaxID=2961598 RepID=UPI0020C930E0|nr:hypothetical protein [Natrinema marinum]